MCTSSPSEPLNCIGTYGIDGTTLSKTFLPDTDLSTVTLYDLTTHIQHNVFTSLVVLPAVLFFISYCGLIYIQIVLTRNRTPEVKKRNRTFFKWAVWVSVASAIGVVSGVTQAADALQWVGDNGMGILDIQTGKTLIGLQWLIVTFSLFFAIGSQWIYNESAERDRLKQQEKKEGRHRQEEEGPRYDISKKPVGRGAKEMTAI